MNYLTKRINTLEESKTIAMAKLSRKLAAEGKDVINLSFGEPDFATPEHIREAAKKAIDEGFAFYPPVAGIPELRKAISDKFKRENNLEFSPEQIVVSTGAKHSIINVILSLVEKGDEVIIPIPYWVSYSEMVKLAEGESVFVEASVEQHFKVTAEQVAKAITPKTKVFLFSSPCNPSGSVYSKDELKAIADVLAPHPQIFVISDEIYEHINYISTHESIAQFENLKDRVVVVNGVSKAFAMTGWRLGYIGAPLFIAQACDKLQSQFTSGTNVIAQKAAVAALNSSLEPTIKMRDEFLNRRDHIFELVKNIPGLKVSIPDGAFYLFPDVKYFFGKSYQNHTIKNSDDLCMYIMDEAHVAIVPGSAFGLEGFIRMSYAASEEKLKTAVERIKIALAKLQ